MLETRSILLIALSVCFLSVKALAETTQHHRQYLAWHKQCHDGDMKVIEAQIQKFEEEIRKSPANQLARAYLGSAYALKAKHAFFPTTKLRSLKKGKKLMEAAIADAPTEDTRVRMVRAIAYFRIPERFGTRETACADFLMLLKQIENGTNELEVNEQQAVLYYASLALLKTNPKKAASAKALCHRLAPQSTYGKLTQ